MIYWLNDVLASAANGYAVAGNLIYFLILLTFKNYFFYKFFAYWQHNFTYCGLDNLMVSQHSYFVIVFTSLLNPSNLIMRCVYSFSDTVVITTNQTFAGNVKYSLTQLCDYDRNT